MQEFYKVNREFANKWGLNFLRNPEYPDPNDDLENNEAFGHEGMTFPYSTTPDLNYFGPDSFNYTVDDNDGDTSNIAEVTIDVGDVNDPPVADPDSASTNEVVANTANIKNAIINNAKFISRFQFDLLVNIHHHVLCEKYLQ